MKIIHSSSSVTIVVIVALSFLVMYSCQRKGTKKDTDTSISVTIPNTTITKQKEDTITIATEETKPEGKSEDKPKGKPEPPTQQQSKPTAPLTPNTPTEDIRISTTGKICLDEQELSLKLTLLSEKMEKDSLMYDNKNATLARLFWYFSSNR